MRRLLAWLLSTALLARAAPSAGSPQENPRPLAEALFQAGKELLAQGKVEEACAKLAESQRLEPGGGTLLLLAICHERQGRWATAAAEFRSALALARRDRRADREKLAERHLAEVERNVSRVRVEGAPRDATIVLDGTPLSSEGAGVPLPVDPGERRLRVEAPGRQPWETVVRVGDEPREHRIEVPPLAPAESGPPSRPVVLAPAPETDAGHGRRTIGWIVAGAGALGVGIGAAFGLDALSKSDEAKSLCDPGACARLDAIELNDAARSSATVSNVAVGLGLAALTAGIVLVLTAPRGGTPTALAPRPFRF